MGWLRGRWETPHSLQPQSRSSCGGPWKATAPVRQQYRGGTLLVMGGEVRWGLWRGWSVHSCRVLGGGDNRELVSTLGSS